MFPDPARPKYCTAGLSINYWTGALFAMKQLFFYESIVALNREQHRNMKLDKSRADAKFAADTHYVPVAGTEFESAARDYPILFANGGGGEGGPILLLGLTEGHNPFITDDNRWRPDTYVPAFVRRYPFVLARQGGEEADAASGDPGYAVCIDEACPAINEDEGDALFDDEGNDSQLLQNSVAFLNQYLADIERTSKFHERLRDLDLLVPRDLQVARTGGQYYTLKDFSFIDVSRLNRLTDAEIAGLQRDGHLAWIHAHLISLGNLSRLEAGAGADESPTDQQA